MNILQENGILLALFDLDDTLTQGHAVFEKYTHFLQQQFANFLHVDLETIRKEFATALIKSRSIHFVDPEPLWATTVDFLIEMYPALAPHKEASLMWLRQIYQESPVLNPEIIILLEKLQAMGIRLGIVTNAAVDWTHFKLFTNGLYRYFSPYSIYTVDPTIKKGVEHWRNAIESEHHAPGHTIIFGDNILSDIIPACELGAIPVYLDQPGNWGEHRKGIDNFDELIIRIRSFNQFFEEFKRYLYLREMYRNILR